MAKTSTPYQRYIIIDKILKEAGEQGIMKGSESKPRPDSLLSRLNYELEARRYRPISESTLRSVDMVRLKKAYGCPIKSYTFDRQLHYRYDDLNFDLASLDITPSEMDILNDANAIIQRLGARDNLADLQEVLGSVVAAGEQISIRSKIVRKDFTKDNEGIEFFKPLYEHCLDKEVIKVAYQSFNKDIEHFDFLPMLLKLYNRRWYCFGYRASNLDRITKISLDRIDDISLSDNQIEFPMVDWDIYFEQMYGVTIPQGEDAKKYDVFIEFHASSAQYITTKPLHPKQKVVEKRPDGGILLKIPQIYLNFELERELFSRGPELEVIGPKELRDKMLELAKQTAKNYK